MKIAVTICILLVVLIVLLCAVNTKPPIYYTSIFNGWDANTIPPFGIFINPEYKGNAEVLNHEMIHWQQFQKMGLIPFYTAYAYQSIVNGYDLNIMEIEARANETEEVKYNYTESVRSGQAQTIYNPYFRM